MTSNMVVRHVHNFVIAGITSGNSLTQLLCDSNVLMNVLYSHNVTISNITLKNCGGSTTTTTSRYTATRNDYGTVSLFLMACSHCKIRSVTVLHMEYYGILGFSVVGESHIEKVNITTHSTSRGCSNGIKLVYLDSRLQNKQIDNTININHLLVIDHGDMICGCRLHLSLRQSQYNMNVILNSSYFENAVDKSAIEINIKSYKCTNKVIIEVCHFYNNSYQNTRFPYNLIDIFLPHTNASVIFQTCIFKNNNYLASLISLKVTDNYDFHKEKCISGYADITNVAFTSNISPLLKFQGLSPQETLYCRYNIYFGGFIFIYKNTIFQNYSHCETGNIGSMIYIHKIVALFYGYVIFDQNFGYKNIIHLDSCDTYFSANITFQKNYCDEIINLKSNTSVNIMKHVSIKFIDNGCNNQLINIDVDDYKKLYPFCLFQYIGPTIDT